MLHSHLREFLPTAAPTSLETSYYTSFKSFTCRCSKPLLYALPILSYKDYILWNCLVFNRNFNCSFHVKVIEIVLLIMLLAYFHSLFITVSILPNLSLIYHTRCQKMPTNLGWLTWFKVNYFKPYGKSCMCWLQDFLSRFV